LARISGLRAMGPELAAGGVPASGDSDPPQPSAQPRGIMHAKSGSQPSFGRAHRLETASPPMLGARNTGRASISLAGTTTLARGSPAHPAEMRAHGLADDCDSGD